MAATWWNCLMHYRYCLALFLAYQSLFSKLLISFDLPRLTCNWNFYLTGSEAMFADLGHFSRSSIQVYYWRDLLLIVLACLELILNSVIFNFYFLFHTDCLLVYNIPIPSPYIFRANSLSSQEPWRLQWWVLQVCSDGCLLAHVHYCNISCDCCKSIFNFSHLFCNQAICRPWIFSAG